MSRFLDTLSASIQLTGQERAVLSQAGVTSIEDLHSLTVGFRHSLARAGVRVPLLSSIAMRHLAGSYAAGMTAAATQPQPSLGAVHPPGTQWNINSVVQSLPAASASAQVVPPAGAAIDLRQGIGWQIMNQGQRGTCVSFASTACVELTQAGAGIALQDFSEQFLYWAIKTGTADPRPNQDGTYLEFARDALAQTGICNEADWPYNPTFIPGNVSQAGNGNPSIGAKTNAAAKRPAAHSYQQFSGPGTGAAAVRQQLQSGRPVAVGVPVFSDDPTVAGNNWTMPVAWAYGRVLNPPPTSVATGGHAVCVVGYEPDHHEPLGGWFVFRNSWGTIWAAQAPSPGNSYSPAPGYGDLSATYVDTYMWEMLVL